MTQRLVSILRLSFSLASLVTPPETRILYIHLHLNPWFLHGRLFGRRSPLSLDLRVAGPPASILSLFFPTFPIPPGAILKGELTIALSPNFT